ncbi:hypothetical protein AAG906_012083 [Vitis piasezkii]
MTRAFRKRVKPRKFQRGDLVLKVLVGLINTLEASLDRPFEPHVVYYGLFFHSALHTFSDLGWGPTLVRFAFIDWIYEHCGHGVILCLFFLASLPFSFRSILHLHIAHLLSRMRALYDPSHHGSGRHIGSEDELFVVVTYCYICIPVGFSIFFYTHSSFILSLFVCFYPRRSSFHFMNDEFFGVWHYLLGDLGLCFPSFHSPFTPGLHYGPSRLHYFGGYRGSHIVFPFSLLASGMLPSLHAGFGSLYMYAGIPFRLMGITPSFHPWSHLCLISGFFQSFVGNPWTSYWGIPLCYHDSPDFTHFLEPFSDSPTLLQTRLILPIFVLEPFSQTRRILPACPEPSPRLAGPFSGTRPELFRYLPEAFSLELFRSLPNPSRTCRNLLPDSLTLSQTRILPALDSTIFQTADPSPDSDFTLFRYRRPFSDTASSLSHSPSFFSPEPSRLGPFSQVLAGFYPLLVLARTFSDTRTFWYLPEPFSGTCPEPSPVLARTLLRYSPEFYSFSVLALTLFRYSPGFHHFSPSLLLGGDKIVGHLGSSLEFISLLRYMHFALTIHSFIHSTEEGHICRPSILSLDTGIYPSGVTSTHRSHMTPLGPLLGLVGVRASCGFVCGPLWCICGSFRRVTMAIFLVVPITL